MTRPVIRGDNREWRAPDRTPRPTPEQTAAVERLCARHATGPADLADLLQLLGIGEEDG